MRRPHQNVATVLVDPRALRDLELELMPLDMWVWPVATSGISPDGSRLAFQIRRLTGFTSPRSRHRLRTLRMATAAPAWNSALSS